MRRRSSTTSSDPLPREQLDRTDGRSMRLIARAPTRSTRRSSTRPTRARGVQRRGRLQQHRRRGGARARKIVVTNTPDVLNEARADLTWGLILGVTRRLGEGERLSAGRLEGIPARLPARHGSRRQDARRDRHGPHRPGRRGQGCGVRHAHGATCRARASATRRRPRRRAVRGPPVVRRADARPDVVTLHVPLSPETHHLVNRERIR